MKTTELEPYVVLLNECYSQPNISMAELKRFAKKNGFTAKKVGDEIHTGPSGCRRKSVATNTNEAKLDIKDWITSSFEVAMNVSMRAMSIKHPDPVEDEIKDAFRALVAEHHGVWYEKLTEAWMTGRRAGLSGDHRALLQRVRNHGDGFQLAHLIYKHMELSNK
jgi:hypothetical protein